MTPRQAILQAKVCDVIFSVASVPGDVHVRITKEEAMRLVRNHKLGFEDANNEVGSVWLAEEGQLAALIFAT